jgi:predicted transposase/invertase (TIGR01784 family)
MRYLDPKNDLTFKKIFGEHPDLLKSFLNAIIPFENNEYIKSLEYLSPEMVPEIPIFKNSLVDVRCTDNCGRQFIVEMQMLWTDSFKSRVLFNASKAYVRQAGKGIQYKGLQPVYSINLVNENFDNKPDTYLHHYKIVHTEDSEDIIEGLEFIFIELPKFKAKNIIEKKIQILWLRFLSEIEDQQEKISPDFNLFPEIKQAVELIQESAFTKAELEAYDKYWDYVSTEKTIKADSLDHGRELGKIEGFMEGEKKGKEEGEKKGKQEEKNMIALTALKKGYSIQDIMELTGLSENEIKNLNA